MSARSNDGKHRQHEAMAASRPLADGRHLTASERINDGKHQRWAGISTTTQRGASRSLAGERHFATSVNGKHLDHTLGEASRSLTSERHFAASERIDDGKHQPIAGRLDHSLMRGISQRQSKSMMGSIDLLSASRSLAGERHFTAP